MTEPSSETLKPAPSSQFCCPIIELRQYTIHPGKRDVLIDLFDREFVETQEAVGIKVIGQFRNVDDPDRFVWLRGFRDMTSRAKALQDFYGGPVWKAHREAANATMIDSDNVLLLRPARATSGFSLGNIKRPPVGAGKLPSSLIVANIYYLESNVADDFIVFFEQTIKPAATNLGAAIAGYFVTENSENTFPALPVREGENVFVWFSVFRNPGEYTDYEAALSKSEQWRDEIATGLAHHLKTAPELLRLTSTARSLLRLI